MRNIVTSRISEMRRLKKKIYLGLWGTAVVVLAIVRAVGGEKRNDLIEKDEVRSEKRNVSDSPNSIQEENVSSSHFSLLTSHPVEKNTSPPKKSYHPIRGVHSYQECFPDAQDVQILAANRHGVRPVRDREQAEERKQELVFVGSNPYYVMDKSMSFSIPYLVPRAADLLQQIGRSYLDSLTVKGIPLHRIIVSSVLRSEKDVERLQLINPNASPESCHRFGTTFDICYNRYNTVCPPGGVRRAVSSDTLKYVLCEVLRDLRQQQRCYVKYEVKQGCFHITTR